METNATAVPDEVDANASSAHRMSRELQYEMLVIAASRGGIKAVGDILAALPADFPVPIAVVLHRTMVTPNHLPEILGWRTNYPVKLAEAGEAMNAGTVYVASPHAHLIVRRDRTFEYVDGTKIRHLRCSANPLFTTAAKALDGHVIAVVLTGGDRDATDGVQSVRDAGGVVLVQDCATSEDYSMPRSAIETGCVNEVLPLSEIAPAIVRLVM
jgi:two-component system chemotaxis response regulator CheB